MNKLLAKLQKKKIQLPETDFYVPELGETLTLRGMTVREGREWRKLLPKEGQDSDTQERGTLAAAAYCVVDPDTGERYLNNDEGRTLLEGLSERTILNLIGAYNTLARDSAESAEGNFVPVAASDGSFFRLALALGRTVDELERTISEAELAGWRAFDRVDPIGMDRADLHAAQIVAMMANLWGRGKETEPYQTVDFMPRFGLAALAAPEDAEPADDGYVPEEQMLAMIDDLMTRQERRKAYEARLAQKQRQN